MSSSEKMKMLDFVRNYNNEELKSFWQQSLKGDIFAKDQLKYFYMKQLYRIKPLYHYLDDDTFYLTLEDSVSKALERGIKFQVDDFDSYMHLASETYFKYFLVPESDSLNIPGELLRAFSRLEAVYNHIPLLKNEKDITQINLLSKGLDYPLFSTRLLYFSFVKWQKNNLRQVDIDLTVPLLPGPQRIEWEVFYEKSLKEIESTIIDEMHQNND